MPDLTIPAKPTTLSWWADDNGGIVCSDHAGSYLDAGIRQNPDAARIRTPITTWERLRDIDIIDLLAELSYIDCYQSIEDLCSTPHEKE